MRLIKSNVLLDTKGVIPVEFGKALIVSTNEDIDFQTVSKASDITGTTSSSELYKKVEVFFSPNPSPANVSVVGKSGVTSSSDLKSFLDSVIEKNIDFYFILLDVFSSELATALSQWAVANEFFPVYCTDKTVSTDDVLALKTALNNRTIACDGWDDKYFDARYIGFMTASALPGYLPWSWREIQGLVANGRTQSDIEKLVDSNINIANEERRGIIVTIPGKTLFGEFIKNEWGSDNMRDDMHIAIVNLLKSNDPPAHPGADLSSAVIIESAIEDVIEDYSSEFRKFISLWSQKEVDEGVANKPIGTPKSRVVCKTDYTQNDIKNGIFEVKWTAVPRGESLEGAVNGLLTFDTNKIIGGE